MDRNPTMILVVAAALLDGNGRVCMQQRPAAKAHGGLWEFPGGKVEAGERPEAALCRELAEELGIAVDPASLEPCGFAAGDGLVILLYRCRAWTGEAHAVEAAAIRWLPPEAVAQLRMPPLDYPLAEQLCRLLGAGAI